MSHLIIDESSKLTGDATRLPVPGVDPYLKCPLTQHLFNDPVMASDGHVYDRAALERLTLNGNVPSPKEEDVELTKDFCTDHTMKQLVDEFVLRDFNILNEAHLVLDAMDPPVGIDEVRYGVYKEKRISARQQSYRPAPEGALAEEKSLARYSHHGHIIKAMGLCVINKSKQLYYISETPDPQYGNLFDFLLGQCQTRVESVSMAQKVTMMRQICSAMVPLALSKEQHRDVATRNIMVFAFEEHDPAETCVKLSEIGTAVRLYSRTRERGDITRRSAHSASGERHCAPEVLMKEKYSEKSDVWAFAVTCLEILTMKPLPVGTTAADIKAYAAEKHLQFIKPETAPERPEECPVLLWNILNPCFAAERSRTTTFLDLREKLEAFKC